MCKHWIIEQQVVHWKNYGFAVVFGCSVCHVATSKTVCIWGAMRGDNNRRECFDMATCGESWLFSVLNSRLITFVVYFFNVWTANSRKLSCGIINMLLKNAKHLPIISYIFYLPSVLGLCLVLSSIKFLFTDQKYIFFYLQIHNCELHAYSMWCRCLLSPQIR